MFWQYLFLVIATGLGCGAGQIKITVVGIITSLILILIINLVTKKKLYEDEILNSSFTFDNRKTDKEINDIMKKIEDCCEEVKFISLVTTESETVINLDIKFKNFQLVTKTIDSIRLTDKSTKIILAKNSMLTL